MRIDLLDSGQASSAETGLADVLIDCVAGGASVGFLAALRHERHGRGGVKRYQTRTA